MRRVPIHTRDIILTRCDLRRTVAQFHQNGQLFEVDKPQLGDVVRSHLECVQSDQFLGQNNQIPRHLQHNAARKFALIDGNRLNYLAALDIVRIPFDRYLNHLQTAQFRLIGGRCNAACDSGTHRLHHAALRRAQTDAAARHLRLLHRGDAVPVDIHSDEVRLLVLAVEFRLHRRNVVA